MAKKDKNTSELDKDSRKRLEKMAEDWHEVNLLPQRLTAFDLRLLLEHHAPLQELIRSIAATGITGITGITAATASPQTPTAPAPPEDTEYTEPQAQEQADAAAWAEQEQALQNAQQTLAQTRIELEHAHRQYDNLQQQCHDTAQQLTQCTARAQQLLQDKQTLAQQLQTLEQQSQQLRHQLHDSRQQLAHRRTAPAALTLLRADRALAQKMELDELPDDDTQALIHTVAVLAQRDNLERLWNTLKDRCEADRRPASADERALLQAALGWYNHNWRTRPYRLNEAAPSSGFDFNQHQRSQHTPSGETVTALLLPGLHDGSGKALRKALVSTQ